MKKILKPEEIVFSPVLIHHFYDLCDTFRDLLLLFRSTHGNKVLEISVEVWICCIRRNVDKVIYGYMHYVCNIDKSLETRLFQTSFYITYI